MISGRQKIFFIPSYLGPLKYMERVSAPLQHTHDIAFVIIQTDQEKWADMVQYCEKKKLVYFDLTPREKRTVFLTVPFVTPLWRRYVHSKECREFLKREQPHKIVARKTIYPYDTIIKEANRLGIETALLQWAFSADGIDRVSREKPSHILKNKRNFKFFIKKIYYNVLRILAFLLDLPLQEQIFGVEPGIPKKFGVFSVKDADHVMRKLGASKETIYVLGSIDVQSGFDLKKKIESNRTYKEQLLKKYGLGVGKINILLIVYRFYHDRGESDLGMDLESHLAFYRDIILMIREVFSLAQADIVLKLHPSEQNVYQSFEELGVKIFGDESSIEELVCVSDLYIASPQTNVNYLVLGSGVPALFINLSRRAYLESYAKNFNILHVIMEREDFIEKINQFKEGVLERQYDTAGFDLRTLDKTVEFISA